MKIKALLFFILALCIGQKCLAQTPACHDFKVYYANMCWNSFPGNYNVQFHATTGYNGIPLTDVYTLTWDFGDGSPIVTNTTVAGNESFFGYHVYQNVGDYTVTFTYGEPGCSTITIKQKVTVEYVHLDFSATPTEGVKGVPITLNFDFICASCTWQPDYYYIIINGNWTSVVGNTYTYTPTRVGIDTVSVIANTEGCDMQKILFIPITCTNCSGMITTSTPMCAGSPTHFINYVGCTGLGKLDMNDILFTWDYGDGTTGTGFSPDHVYSSKGTYTVKLYYQLKNGNSTSTCSILPAGTTSVVVDTCTPPPCDQCIGSFAPTAGNYIVGAWVKQENAPTALTYDKAGVKITCHLRNGADIVSGPFYPDPNGKIIEGWQRIEQKFTVPLNTKYIKIHMVNTGTINAYFDDIRIHPLDATMKSYVYDPLTLRLMAELDENNYATFYEYDEEGALIRVKKETEKGIMTIKENRNNSSKP